MVTGAAAYTPTPHMHVRGVPLPADALAVQLQALERASQHAVASPSSAGFTLVGTPRRGEPLGVMLKRMKVLAPGLDGALASTQQATAWHALRTDDELRLRLDAGGRLLRLELDRFGADGRTGIAEQIVRTGAKRYAFRRVPFRTRVHIVTRTGRMRGGLFTALAAAGVPGTVVAELPRAFAGSLDLRRMLPRDTRFELVFATRSHRGRSVGNANLLLAEIRTGGQRHVAARCDAAASIGATAPDSGRYCDGQGRMLGRRFLAAPVNGGRISSRFGWRADPRLGIRRHHDGTDFAAPGGSPIHVTGDGRVKFVGTQQGYGRIVIVDHGDGIETVYAHLRNAAPGLRAGARIERGTVLGFVGRSGVATGNHVHYEVRERGRPVPPTRLASIEAGGTDRRRAAAFRRATAPWFARLRLLARLEGHDNRRG